MTDERAEARAIALRFLQTVVVVDDNAYPGEASTIPMVASLGGEELGDGSVEPSGAVEEDGFDALDPLGFETEKIVEGFADLGMNCAVLAPTRNEEAQDERRLVRLAGRSDVVILDWVIRPRTVFSVREPSTAERTSLGLLLKVLREDATAGGARIRLVCIYTGESNAGHILDSVQAALESEFAEATIIRDGPRIDFGAARIVLLGKEKQVPVPGLLTVPAAALPSRVVDEFTEFVATGLLPEIALESLSAVRDQGHRLLRRFSGELDPALLSHRSFTSSADAEQFALSLIGSELAAVVAAADVAAPLRDERVERVVRAALDGRADAFYWKSLNATKTSQISAANAVKALTLGVDGGGKIRDSTEKLDKKASRSSLMLRGDDSAVRVQAREIDLRFSALSSLARDSTFEGRGVPVPSLQLGAILASKVPPQSLLVPSETGGVDGESTTEFSARDSGMNEPSATYRYWICMQPLCDSIRLTKPTKFPMLPLQPPSESNPKFELVVNDQNEYVPLQNAASKISQMDLKTFVPDEKRQIVVGLWNENGWEFTDSEKNTYVWLGSLRFDKAHKLLHSVVTTAGRIGIDEYEFLRLAYA